MRDRIAYEAGKLADGMLATRASPDLAKRTPLAASSAIVGQ
jgi:hypothetical protein